MCPDWFAFIWVHVQERTWFLFAQKILGSVEFAIVFWKIEDFLCSVCLEFLRFIHFNFLEGKYFVVIPLSADDLAIQKIIFLFRAPGSLKLACLYKASLLLYDIDGNSEVIVDLSEV